ncbi:MAG: fibronectin type III domain-containing protein [Candidatus Kapaibacterium sp.]|nr:MAG: fibronectin type III domain-containing protein [Candidatus Kapabacteria bacterium]
MKFSRFFSALACACLVAFALVSCENPAGGGTGTGTGGGGTTPIVVPPAVSGLQATSVDDTTVRLRWTAVTGATVTAATVTGYRVTVLSSTGSVVATGTPTNSIVDIGGLVAGRVYTFRVQARTRDTVSPERTIMWSPATRVRMSGTGGAVRLYESNSSFGSGLSFQGGVATNRQVADARLWDLGLDTRPNTAGQASFDIGSPNATSYTAFANSGGRRTIVSSNVYTSIDSLNQVFDTQLNVGTTEQLINFNTANRGFVMAVRTQDGNFAKVFVKAAGNVILQGTAPNRYVEVEISYQPVANVPYAVNFNKAAESAVHSDMESAGLRFVGKKVSSQKD